MRNQLLKTLFRAAGITKLFIFLFFFCFVPLKAQVAPGYYWIGFTDKTGSEYTIENPEAFLSERSLERRTHHNISITEEDLPVSKVYIDSLKSLGADIHLVSKWFNGVVIKCNNTALLDSIYRLGFTMQDENPGTKEIRHVSNYNKVLDTISIRSNLDEDSQLTMLNGHLMHKAGFKGKGMLIAVHDGGFTNTNKAAPFGYLFDNDKILIARNFTREDESPYDGAYHGTMVLSTIACDTTEYSFPTAPDADFLLLRTENTGSEYRIEEYNWLAAAELSDSAGADIINSSLGYSTFTDSDHNYTYEEMNGTTAVISRAARIASRKGMIVVTSAGNSYNTSWKYITAPADADSILTVGAVYEDELITNFSSRGPSSDGRIKPDVVAMGGYSYVIHPIAGLSQASGTSFSSPITAGMVACLWQAVPYAKSWEVLDAIKQSSDKYNTPDTTYGYGLPDYWLAKEKLQELYASNYYDITTLNIVPNPINYDAELKIIVPWLTKTTDASINVINLMGQRISNTIYPIQTNFNYIPLTEINQNLTPGIYFIQVIIEKRAYTAKFLKL